MTASLSADLQRRAARQWGFLENHTDACGVVTSRMELVYLNAAARKLVPAKWFGCRCWQAFPVRAGCAACCPVVRAVIASAAACYCEEMIRPPDGGPPLQLGLAVVSAPDGAVDGAALLVMRPKRAGESADALRQPLLAEAERLCACGRERTPPAGNAE